jgi:hypothetical protein
MPENSGGALLPPKPPTGTYSGGALSAEPPSEQARAVKAYLKRIVADRQKVESEYRDSIGALILAIGAMEAMFNELIAASHQVPVDLTNAYIDDVLADMPLGRKRSLVHQIAMKFIPEDAGWLFGDNRSTTAEAITARNRVAHGRLDEVDAGTGTVTIITGVKNKGYRPKSYTRLELADHHDRAREAEAWCFAIMKKMDER